MPRPLSQFIQDSFAKAEILNTRLYNTIQALDITLRTGAKLSLATATATMTSVSKNGVSVAIDPIAFEGRLQAIPELRFSQDEVSDVGDIQAINLDWALSQLIPNEDRLFDNASAKLYLCFPKPDGTYEGLILFVGIVRNLAGDGEQAKYALLSDFSDKRSTVVEQITQKCVAELGDAWCGAQLLPPNATCSKVYDDEENGCAFYGQQHAFKGIPFINPIGLLPNYTGGVGVGGWEPGGGYGCVDPQSWILAPQNVWVQAHQLRKGDAVQDHLGRVLTVTNFETKAVKYRYRITTERGVKLICSADHPLLTALDDQDGTQAYALNGEDRVLKAQKLVTVCEGVTSLSEEFYFEPLAGGEVLKISVTEPHIYVAGVERGYGIAGHNNKPIYTGLEIQQY